MARLLAHRDEVREHFPDGVVWVTVGEDAAGPELAEKVINAVCLVGGDRPAVTDPVAAGAELGRAMGNRRVLLVVDDVWSAAQVEPFLIGGPGAVRLFTTRIRGVLPGSAELVRGPCQLVRSGAPRRSFSAWLRRDGRSCRVVQAAVVRPVTSFQVLKRLAISLRYSSAWSR
jgi:hypothetical protein